jgi:hypothetical protein
MTSCSASGGLAHPVLDEHALAWWNAQPDRAAAARRGCDHMIRRGMIDPSAGRIHPELGVILAARISSGVHHGLSPAAGAGKA